MRAFWIAAAALLTMCNGADGAGRAPTGSDVVAYAKQIDVAKLEASLRSQPLERWLSTSGLHLQSVAWSRGDCGIRPAEPPSNRDYPLCARVDFRTSDTWGWISLKIGTIRKGDQGRPELQHCVVKSAGPPPTGTFHEVKKLSDLRGVLEIATAEKRRQ